LATRADGGFGDLIGDAALGAVQTKPKPTNPKQAKLTESGAPTMHRRRLDVILLTHLLCDLRTLDQNRAARNDNSACLNGGSRPAAGDRANTQPPRADAQSPPKRDLGASLGGAAVKGVSSNR
jgi:hypothetical protein